MKPLSAYYSLPKLAVLLDRSTKWIRRQIDNGNFDAVRIGDRLAVDAGSVNRYLEANRVQPNPNRKATDADTW